jgi:DNA polymerase
MVDHVLEVMALGSLELVEWYFGDALLAISGCVRGLFVAGPGMDLIASDYSAIEAVVSAALAGETWRLEVFASGTDIYLAGASKITGTPVEDYIAYAETHGEGHPDRQIIGKVSELACGFGGWVNSYIAFGSQEPEAIIKDQILAWRAASPQIAAIWGGQRSRNQWGGWTDELYGIEGAIIAAIQAPGSVQGLRPPNDGRTLPFPAQLTFRVENDVLIMRLPSGREILYHHPRLEPSNNRPGTLAISYMTWNSNPKYGPMGWVRMSTWGSRVFENAVQAVAHDILRGAIIRLRAAGYPTVLHVYDEIVVEVPEGTGSIEEVERLMLPVESWAFGWPIKASGGWRGKRFRKG